MSYKTATVDSEEIRHFAKDSGHWWDEDGPFKPLHRLNPVRLQFIRDQVCAHFERDTDNMKPFSKLRMIDIGCGGGLVTEPLCRMGADVTGLDADANAIAVANDHAAQGKLDIRYESSSTGEFLETVPAQYDVVLALEIIEHVADQQRFISECVDLCKPGGLIVLSTLNRTAKSYALGIVAAEYILRWVPHGTHQWKKFVRPAEMARSLRQCGALPLKQNGLIFNPLKGDFELSDTDFDVNYLITAVKS